MNCYWWAPLKEEVVDLKLHLQEDATGIRLKGESCRKMSGGVLPHNSAVGHVRSLEVDSQ